MKAKTKAWIEVAESDLRAAKTLFLKKHYLQAVFLCHGHLRRLLMKQSKMKFPEAVDETIIRRYYDRSFAAKFLANTEEIIQWLKENCLK